MLIEHKEDLLAHLLHVAFPGKIILRDPVSRETLCMIGHVDRLAFKTNLKASEFIIIIIIMQWILASHKIKMNVVFSTKETFFAQLISNNIAYMTKEQISITNNLSS